MANYRSETEWKKSKSFKDLEVFNNGTGVVKTLIKDIASGKIPIHFGLVQQGHIPLIEEMLNDGKTWDDIGKAIKWEPNTAKDYYYIYLFEKNKHLASIINDLTLSLEMWIEGYPFDDNHKVKQLRLINEACVLIGKPRTIEELKTMVYSIKDAQEQLTMFEAVPRSKADYRPKA